MKAALLNIYALFVLALIVVVIGCSPTTSIIQVENGLLIENITVISSEKDTIYPESTVLIQGDSIIYVGQKEIRISGTYTTIEGKNKYLIPGLIDSHVHVSSIPGMGPEQEKDNPALIEAYRKQQPKSYLYFGFTTLIDLIGDMDRINEFKRQPLGPDLYYAGSPAVVANGYPMHYFPSPLRFQLFPNFLYLPGQAKNIPTGFLPEEHTPKAVVERIKKSGAIAVKTTYEPGFDSPELLPVPSLKLLKELKVEAHRQGLPLLAHGNSLEAHQILTEAGVDIIVHGLWNWDAYYQADTIVPAIRQLLEEEINKNIGYMPTLQVIEGLKELLVPGFLDDAQLKHVYHSALLNWYKSDAGQWYSKAIKGEGTSEQMQQVFSHIALHGRQAAAYMAKHQGSVLFGSDTPSSPTYANPPGYNGYLEIQQLHKAGISPKQILASATIENAKAFNLEHQYGTVERGKKANLLILEKNPLEDVSAYDAIHTVIIRGKAIERETLSAARQK